MSRISDTLLFSLGLCVLVFVISADGLALTNHHVMASISYNADIVVATTLDGRVVRVKEILTSNTADDVALIRLAGDDFHPLPIAVSAPVGSDLVIVSHPRQTFYYLTKGQLSRHTRFLGGHRIMVTSEFAVGSSGAPILDRFGNVAGLVEKTRSLAANEIAVHPGEGGSLKLGKAANNNGLLLSTHHQMTIGIGVPCKSLHAFLTPLPPENSE